MIAVSMTYANLTPGDRVIVADKVRRVASVEHDIRPNYHYVIVRLVGLKQVIAMPATESVEVAA